MQSQHHDFFFLLAVMYKAAPGQAYFDELSPVAQTQGLAAMANSLSSNPSFVDIYPAESDDEFAQQFIGSVVGAIVSDAEKAWAIKEAQAKMAAGSTRGEIVNWAVDALKNLNPNSGNWSDLKQYYDNAAAVSEWWTLDAKQTSLQLQDLKAVFTGLTADIEGASARIEALKVELNIDNVDLALLNNGDISPIDNPEFEATAEQQDTTSAVVALETPTVLDITSPSDQLFVVTGTDTKVVLTDEATALLGGSFHAWTDGASSLPFTHPRITYNGENIVFESESGIDGAVYDGNTDTSPLFNTAFSVLVTETAVLNVGNSNNLIDIASYYTAAPDDALTGVWPDGVRDPSDYANGTLVVNLGAGTNAFQLRSDDIAIDAFGSVINFQSTVIYGFGDDDLIVDTDTSAEFGLNGVYGSVEALLNHVSVVDGNTVISAPGEGDIVLVGVTDLQADQFVSF